MLVVNLVVSYYEPWPYRKGYTITEILLSERLGYPRGSNKGWSTEANLTVQRRTYSYPGTGNLYTLIEG